MDRVVAVGVALVAGGALVVAPAEVLAAGVGALLLLSRSGKVASTAVMCVLALLASAWRAQRAIDRHEAERDGIALALPAPARCAARGVVEGSSVATHGTLRWSARLEDLECDAPPGALPLPSGPVMATLYGGPADLARGDRVDVIAQLARPQRFWNVETGDPRPSDARRGAVLSGGTVDVRIRARGTGPAAWIDRVRARVRGRIQATFRADVAPMARALVLGESDLGDDDDADFRASGLSHLLAVSGMHLVLVAIGFVRVMEVVLVRVGALSARLDVGRLVAAVAVPLVWIYADFAGSGGSTLRAAWMMTAALLARTIGRKSTASRAFGVSLVTMAAGDPLVIHDVSFLLSAAATLGLMALSRPLAELASRWAPKGPPVLAKASDWFVTTASATLAATIPCAPVLARFAPTLPAGGVLANLLAVPLGEMVALPICLMHAALPWFPSAERGCAAVATGALALVRAVAHAFAHARWSLVPVPPPTAWQCTFLALAVMAAVVPTPVQVPRAHFAPSRSSAPGRRVWTGVSLLVVLALELLVRCRSHTRGALRATFLDVGQGDSALIDLPSGEAVLIDGGGLVGSPVDTGVRVVSPVIRARRRSSLLGVILSHPHPDHFTGLATGLDGVRVGALWDTGQGEREGVGGGYATLLANMRRANVRVLRPDRLCGARILGGAWVEVLAPCPASSPDRGPNDNSFVIRITYGARAMLFVGDAEAEEEKDLVSLGAERLRADVLKVGHHGSRTSSGAAFLAAVAPKLAVISSGVRNRFGHPHPKTLAAFAAAGVPVFRTDRDGAVSAWTDGARLEVRTASGERRAELW